MHSIRTVILFFVAAAHVLAATGNLAHAADAVQASGQAKATQLSADDQKRFDEAVNLINVFEGTGNHLEQAFKILTDLAQRNPQSGYPTAGLAELKYRLATLGKGSHREALALAQRAIKLD